ncbi:hypothetical protein BCD67_07630 [Oscillatoriales cyanobacterium USR001]|nr:hypothetical protein BCD67_07630 [Oscillatoriales cyanobacterium USR001]
MRDIYFDCCNGGIIAVDVAQNGKGWVLCTEEDFDQDSEAILEFCRETIRLVEAAEIPEGQLSLPFDDDDIGFVEEQLMSEAECKAQEFYELLQTIENLPIAKQATIIREIGDRLGRDTVISILGF